MRVGVTSITKTVWMGVYEIKITLHEGVKILGVPPLFFLEQQYDFLCLLGDLLPVLLQQNDDVESKSSGKIIYFCRC